MKKFLLSFLLVLLVLTGCSSKEEKLAMGDEVVFDFEGSKDGEVFNGGTAEDYKGTLGQLGFIDGFESQMVGMKKGETKTITVTFPENYTVDLAGQDVQFKITIKDIKKAK